MRGACLVWGHRPIQQHFFFGVLLLLLMMPCLFTLSFLFALAAYRLNHDKCAFDSKSTFIWTNNRSFIMTWDLHICAAATAAAAW